LESLLKPNHFQKKSVMRIYSGFYLVMTVFSFLWAILGSVWVYQSEDCEEGNFNVEFFDGWALSLAILSIYYCYTGYIFCALLCNFCTLCSGKTLGSVVSNVILERRRRKNQN